MEKKAKKTIQKSNPEEIDGVYCFYDGLAYSIGAYVKVDGLTSKLLYCKADGTWELKDPPDKKKK